ncbi:MAG: hypothetical protein Q9172_000616 [Xanthocarpia lactea]
MKFLRDCWVALLELFNAVTLAPSFDHPDSQHILDGGYGTSNDNGGPVFAPPSHAQNPDKVLTCDYSPMGRHWRPCSTPHSRACWLAGPGGQEFNILTDYETKAPTGITRKYTLTADEMNINADGVPMPYGKVFNKQYPGPWIQACWGDTLEITVKNNLSFNGTTIHWHGLRQLESLEMDGVNGVTQCPIAPGESYTYRFRAIQYGTSWYHSHYSLQYGDGMVGPLTIHGPHSSNYDEPKDPILMTDWNHRSGFQDFYIELEGRPPPMDSILLNGQGSYAGGGHQGYKYRTHFKRGRKYLLRLINTSVATTFVFAIDNHKITVMSSDFVPIHPYVTDHVVVGIGQRYHVVVEANPKNPDGTPNHSEAFWMRTIPSPGCESFQEGGTPNGRQGIVYYKQGSTAYPLTAPGNYSLACRDEPFEKLRPVLAEGWVVPKPGPLDQPNDDLFHTGVDPPVPGQGRPLPSDMFVRWAIGPKALFVNFSDPTILNLENKEWDPDYVVIPKNIPEGNWIYMIIFGNTTSIPSMARRTIPAAHPIHLHGHDFALLQQSTEPFDPALFNPKLDNPPRRDVVLLPANGFVAIAFKTDNPGAWLIHCHIAWHASSGLAMQILESQEALQKQMTRARLEPVEKGCATWDKWFSDPKNLWDPNVTFFQEDSGI